MLGRLELSFVLALSHVDLRSDIVIASIVSAVPALVL